jgi:hypothetical protein
MQLPKGMTCGDCANFTRCQMLGVAGWWATTCDWSPSRFYPASPTPHPAHEGSTVKIAPTLHDMIEDASRLGLGYAPEKCRRELRALLAVARAAKRLTVTTGDDHYVNTESMTDGEAIALLNALARLAKVSR